MKKLHTILFTAAITAVMTTGAYAKPIVITNTNGNIKNTIHKIMQSNLINNKNVSLEDICKELGIVGGIINNDCPITNIPNKPENNKPENNKPENNKPENKKPGNNKPENNKPENNKPENNKPENNKPENNKPETEVPDQNISQFSQEVVRLVNIERQKVGLSPLSIDSKVQNAAQIRAKEQEQSFSHTRPNGTSYDTALTEQGVNRKGSGENIAWGQKTPQQVMDGWMNSAGHKANILNKNFTSIGVGYYKGSNGTNYWTQLFIY